MSKRDRQATEREERARRRREQKGDLLLPVLLHGKPKKKRTTPTDENVQSMALPHSSAIVPADKGSAPVDPVAQKELPESAAGGNLQVETGHREEQSPKQGTEEEPTEGGHALTPLWTQVPIEGPVPTLYANVFYSPETLRPDAHGFYRMTMQSAEMPAFTSTGLLVRAPDQESAVSPMEMVQALPKLADITGVIDKSVLLGRLAYNPARLPH